MKYLIPLLLVLILVSGCVEEKSISPVKIEMQILQTPKLGDVVDIQLIVSTKIDSPNINVKLITPEGFEYVSGDLVESGDLVDNEWIGSLNANQIKELNLKLKAVKSGEYWQVTSTVTSLVEGGQYGGADILFVSFDENSGEIVKEKPVTPILPEDDYRPGMAKEGDEVPKESQEDGTLGLSTEEDLFEAIRNAVDEHLKK